MARPPSSDTPVPKPEDDAAEWLRRLFQRIAAHMRDVTDGLTRQLTVSENLAGGWYEFTHTKGQALPKPFAVDGLGGREPYAVDLVRWYDNTGAMTWADFQWTPIQKEGRWLVRLDSFSSDLPTGETATLRFRILAK
jgi:hypothetical protein